MINTQPLHIKHTIVVNSTQSPSSCLFSVRTVHTTQLTKKVTLSAEQQNNVDDRFLRLLGHGGIGRSNKSVFDKSHSMKAADWLHFLQYCDVYVFHKTLPEDQAIGYWGLTAIFRALLRMECTTDEADDVAMKKMDDLSAWIAEGLSVYERSWPATLFSGPHIHNLLHFPRLIYRWNATRNYWCFFNER